MAFNNRNNLNPQSAPWGREVEQKIEGTERGLSSLRALTENNNKATNATLGALSRQQDSIIATQQRLADTSSVIARTSSFTKSGGASNGQVTEYETTVDRPAWANFAIVQVITSAVTGTLVPDGSAMEEPEVSAYAFASNTSIPNSIDFNNWRVCWYVTPYDLGGAVQAFAVDVSSSSVLYLKQRVNYLAVTSANVSAVQAFSILWV